MDIYGLDIEDVYILQRLVKAKQENLKAMKRGVDQKEVDRVDALAKTLADAILYERMGR